MRFRFFHGVVGTLYLLGALATALHAHAGELEDRFWLRLEARASFQNSEFAELEAMAKRLRKPSERTSSGLAKLTMFYSGLIEYVRHNFSPEDQPSADSISRAFVAAHPESPTAHLVRATYLLWSISDDGAPRADRPEEARDRTPKERLVELLAYLDEIRWTGEVDPQWFDLRIRTLKRLGRPDEEIHAAIDEGLAAHPEYLQLYFVALDVFAPRWGGDAREVEFYTQYVVRRTRATLGEAMYARIYWYAFQVHYGISLFASSDVDWERMKVGIDDVLSRYPDQWNIQNFAFFACLKEDQPFLERLFLRIEGEPILGAWYNQRAVYDHCREFALGTPG